MTNRRLFAIAANGIPDGIKCDMEGNVYSGCGDGINVWCPGGVLLGVIKVEVGAANFCFGREGSLYILNEHCVRNNVTAVCKTIVKTAILSETRFSSKSRRPSHLLFIKTRIAPQHYLRYL
jgi:gluconolactonase